MLKECENGKTNWLTNVRILLQESGYPDVWLFRDSIINVPYFLKLVKIRLKDIYILDVERRHAKFECTNVILFKEIKERFELPPYLLILAKS
jgi:hypothetical protein